MQYKGRLKNGVIWAVTGLALVGALITTAHFQSSAHKLQQDEVAIQDKAVVEIPRFKNKTPADRSVLPEDMQGLAKEIPNTVIYKITDLELQQSAINAGMLSLLEQNSDAFLLTGESKDFRICRGLLRPPTAGGVWRRVDNIRERSRLRASAVNEKYAVVQDITDRAEGGCHVEIYLLQLVVNPNPQRPGPPQIRRSVGRNNPRQSPRGALRPTPTQQH